jgi:hypothetical protein
MYQTALTFIGGESYCGNTVEASGALAGTGDCSDLYNGNKE